jgi:tRNA(fMet)-specific endonuclease VapC
VDKALLDSDIYSEVLKGIDARVVARAAAYHAVFGRYTISVITVMEIIKGFHKLRRASRIQQFRRIQGLGYGLKLDNWRR